LAEKVEMILLKQEWKWIKSYNKGSQMFNYIQEAYENNRSPFEVIDKVKEVISSEKLQHLETIEDEMFDLLDEMCVECVHCEFTNYYL
jgi:hypothetical protein